MLHSFSPSMSAVSFFLFFSIFVSFTDNHIAACSSLIFLSIGTIFVFDLIFARVTTSLFNLYQAFCTPVGSWICCGAMTAQSFRYSISFCVSSTCCSISCSSFLSCIRYIGHGYLPFPTNRSL